MRIDVNAVLLQYFEQTAPPQTRAEAVLLAAAEALRTLLGAEEVRFVVRLGTLLKELTFPGQITRARTENEDDMILACLAHCAGKPVCVCAQNGGKAFLQFQNKRPAWAFAQGVEAFVLLHDEP